MRLRLASILLIAALFCAMGAQAWAMGATRLWETDVFDGTPSFSCIAVDPSSGAVYVGVNGNQIAKIDPTTHAVVGTYGPAIYKADGTVGGNITGTAPQPRGMAVDPLTGYLYANCGGTALVIDMSVATSDPKSAHWIRNQANLRNYQLSFAPDGQYLASCSGTTNVTLVLHRKSDGTFDVTNNKVNYTPSLGILTPNNISDPRGCAIDNAGHVFQADNYAAHPINRFTLVPGVTGSVTFVAKQDMSFRAVHTAVNTIDTDGYGNVWVGDMCNATYPTSHRVHCFHDGLEVGSFDLWDGHNDYYPNFPSNGAMAGQILCCSKNTTGNVKVYVTGSNDPTGISSTAQYVACYEITAAALPATGTISGTVHDNTTAAVNPVTIGIQRTYFDDTDSGWGNVPLVGYSPSTTNGTFSNLPVPPGSWTVVAQKDEAVATRAWLPTHKTHYEVATGANTDVGDIVVIPKAAGYVQATLGTHNVEQGLYILNSRNSAFSNTAVANIGDRDCRTFGDSSSPDMICDVDNTFWAAIPSYVTQPFWLDFDIYDSGFDRMTVLANTRPLGNGNGDAAATSMAWQPKTDTGAWTTWKRYRDDGCFAGWFGYQCAPTGPVYCPGGDFSLHAVGTDLYGPGGTKHIARIAVRTTPLAADASYMPVDTIANVKRFVLGQRLDSDIQVRYLGGVAVKLVNKTVVAKGTLNGRKFVVIEDTNRSSAIRVMTNDAITVPKIVDVVGALRCDPDTQELVINAVNITQHPETADAIKPVEWANMGGVSGRGLDYVVDPVSQTIPFPIQPGVSGGRGVSTVGLLVRLAGKVNATGTESDGTPFAYVDDGSSPRGGGVLGDVDHKGVKVLLDATAGFPVVGATDFITVTGASMLGLYDPTPGSPNNLDEWRYPVVYATAVAKI